MTPAVDADEVRHRIEQVRSRLERVGAGRDVRLVAVTKGFDVSAPRAAVAAGCTACGENYAQELVAKDAELADDEREVIDWHFIGRLQRNKVKSLAPLVAVWQSVDRMELLEEIARRAPGDPEDARPGFRRLVTLADALGLPERSIGMSHDLDVAVAEGATMVRIGTALFGARPPRP